MNFNFGEVLSRAWQIVWKHRVLWIFGILASCSRGGSSFNTGNSASGSDFNFDGGTPNLPPEVLRFFNFLADNWISLLTVTIAIICVIWIVAIFLGTIGRIGLIRGTWQAETEEGNLIFGQLFSESLPYFWRVFLLSLLVGLPFLIVIGGFVLAMLAFGITLAQGGDASAIGFLSLMPLIFCCICLLVPVSFVINMIVRQAERAIVLENAGVLPALSRGWDIFRANLGSIIVMAIILAVIGLVAGFVVAIPVLFIVIPTTIAFVAGNAQNWNPLFFALACMCLYAPLAWLINGILIAYTESAWTLTYMRITRPPDTSPVIIEANA